MAMMMVMMLMLMMMNQVVLEKSLSNTKAIACCFVFMLSWGWSLLHNPGNDDVLDGLRREDADWMSGRDRQLQPAFSDSRIWFTLHLSHRIEQSYPVLAGPWRLEHQSVPPY
jgi:hypothetical protein